MSHDGEARPQVSCIFLKKKYQEMIKITISFSKRILATRASAIHGASYTTLFETE